MMGSRWVPAVTRDRTNERALADGEDVGYERERAVEE